MPTREEFHKRWLELILSVELPERDTIKLHLDAATSVTYCQCGCHSFDLHIPEGTRLPPLSDGRCLFSEFAFETNYEDVLEFILFTDERGYLRSVDVTYGDSNHAPIPEDVEVKSFKWVVG